MLAPLTTGHARITTRKQAEEALRSSEQRYRLLFERNVAGVAIASLDGRVLNCNDGWAHILRYESRDEVLGRHASEFYFNPADRKPLVDELFEKQVLCSRELQLRGRDGGPVWVLFNAAVLSDYAGPIVQCTMIDISEWKRAKEARFRHAAIVESSDDGISSVTLDGVTATWNAGAQRMFGYTENEVIGKPASIIVPPELRDQQKKLLETLRAGGRIEQFETVRVSKTGRRIDVSLSVSPIKDSTGKVVGCAGTARDITTRKRAEEALRSSEQRYRLLFERNVAGVAIASLDGRLLDCNDSWARILRYESRDEIIGLHGSEFYFKPAERQPLVDELFEKQVLFSRELQMRGKDGTPVWVLFNAAVHADHDRPIVQATMIDISEWKSAEETRVRHAAIVESSEDAIISKDLQAVITGWNAAAQQMFGYTEEEAVGQPITILIPPHLQHEENKILEKIKAGERIEHYETVRVTKAGRRVDVSLSISPIRDSTGKVVGASKIARDISERKLAEQAVADIRRKLVAIQEEERARIARDLHDDINQRLAMLAVEMDLLKKNPPSSSAELRRQLNDFREQIVEVSREVQSISHQLHSPQLEYLGVVAAMKSFCREFSARQAVQIDFKNDDIPQPVSYDISLCLFRILQEALNNAAKHSKARHFDVKLGYGENQLGLTVSDHGAGFDAESALDKGGLGLISMRERVRSVNGTLTIDSKPMGGTTIHVHVPLASGHEEQRAVGQS